MMGLKRFGVFLNWRGVFVLFSMAACTNAGPDLFCIWMVFATVGACAELSHVILVRQCAKHPERAELWQEFQRRFLAPLRGWALQALRRYDPKEIAHYREAVDDLVQEVCVRLVQNDFFALREFRGNTEEALFAYLRIITQRMALNRLREIRAQKRPQLARSLDEDLDDGSDGSSTHAHHKINAPSEDEHERLHDLQEQINYYLDLVLRGPRKHRDKLLFQLYHFDGVSAEEIANLPGIHMKPHAVEVAVNRVCHRLSKYARQIMA